MPIPTYRLKPTPGADRYIARCH